MLQLLDAQKMYWYVNCAALSHITHDISIFLSFNFNDNSKDILAANRVVLRTWGSGIIVLATSVNRVDLFVHFHNIHSCFEINTNLLSLGALEAKKLWFSAENSILEVWNFDSETVFQTKRCDSVYPLLQSMLQEYHHWSKKVYYMTKAIPATREQWHERTSYANYKNLQ